MYNIVLKYESVLNKLSEFIEEGPYKLEYIIEKLQISRATFYNKRKSNNFNVEEVKILARMYDDIDLSNRLQKQIEEGLNDSDEGNIYDFDTMLAETRRKYGL